MKKLIYLLAVVLCFSACAKPVTIISQSTSQNIAPEINQKPNLIKCTPGTDQGRYEVANLIDRQVLIYIDYATATEVALCSTPSCAHNVEGGCTAVPAAGRHLSMMYYIASKDKLAQITYGRLGFEPQRLQICDKDGSNVKELYACNSGEMLSILYAADSETLYFNLDKKTADGAKQFIYSVPFAGGDVKKVHEMESTSNKFMGAVNRDLFFFQWNWGKNPQFYPPVPPENATEEEIIKLEEEFKNNTKCENNVIKVNVDTGEKSVLLQWSTTLSDLGRDVFVNGDTVYWCDKNYLGKINGDNSQQQIEVKLPQQVKDTAVIVKIEAFIQDFAIVSVTDNKDKTTRYSIDANTGQAVEISLNFFANAKETPISICGISQDSLLVQYKNNMTNTIDILPDGTPFDSYNIKNSFALISYEDFFASKPNYKRIDTVFATDLLGY